MAVVLQGRIVLLRENTNQQSQWQLQVQPAAISMSMQLPLLFYQSLPSLQVPGASRPPAIRTCNRILPAITLVLHGLFPFSSHFSHHALVRLNLHPCHCQSCQSALVDVLDESDNDDDFNNGGELV